MLSLFFGVFVLTYAVMSLLPNFWIREGELPESGISDYFWVIGCILVGGFFTAKGFKNHRFSFRTKLAITCFWISCIWFFFAFLGVFNSRVSYLYPPYACILASVPFIIVGFLLCFLPVIHFRFREMGMAQLFLTAMLFFGGALMSISAFLIISDPKRAEASQNRKFVTVPANKMWFDTGIDAPGNKTVDIIYQSGEWSYYSNSWYSFGPDGKELRLANKKELPPLMPKETRGKLLAKIGESSPLACGSNCASAYSKGRLYLSINDTPGEFEENPGEITVEVIIR
jgi:hypothetical protein